MKYLTIIAISIILGGGILASAIRVAPRDASVSPPEAVPTIEYEVHYLDGRRFPRMEKVFAVDMATAIQLFNDDHKIKTYWITCVNDANWNLCTQRDPNAHH